ncbi:MAG: hypothetical protein KTR15_03930 [Phycisphaeraceae bacterium]|nr:hypothetical protein [Phycisphaeraceae bacterium]
MQPLIAYVLTLVSIPVVGLLVFFITMPILVAMFEGASSHFYFFSSHALANVARCATAWAVFHVLGVPFGIEPMLLIAVVMAMVNIGRVKESLDAYAGRLSELGLQTDSNPALLNLAKMTDDKFKMLHSEVGDSIAGLVGSERAGLAAAEIHNPLPARHIATKACLVRELGLLQTLSFFAADCAS